MNAVGHPIPAPAAPPAPESERRDVATQAEQPSPGAKRLVIEVSPRAVDAIARQIKKRGTPDTSLRVGLRGGGCSGFTYVVEFHDGPPRQKDNVLDFVASDGTPVRVLVDPKSLLYLSGSTLEWEQTIMKQGFKFINPHEKAGCGCGHSFNV
jgi:iron-sulfur cluster assembly protein